MSRLYSNLVVLSRDEAKILFTVMIDMDFEFEKTTIKGLKKLFLKRVGLDEKQCKTFDLELTDPNSQQKINDDNVVIQSKNFTRNLSNRGVLYYYHSFKLPNEPLIKTYLSADELKTLHTNFEKQEEKEETKYLRSNPQFFAFLDKKSLDAIQKKLKDDKRGFSTYTIDRSSYICNYYERGLEHTIDLPKERLKSIVESCFKDKPNATTLDQTTIEKIKELIEEPYQLQRKFSIFKSIMGNVVFNYSEKNAMFVHDQPRLKFKDWDVKQIIGAKSMLMLDPPLGNLKDAQSRKNIASIEFNPEGLQIQFPCINNDTIKTKEYSERYLSALENEGFKNCTVCPVNEKSKSGHYTSSVFIPYKDVERFVKNVCKINDQEYKKLCEIMPDIKSSKFGV